MYVLSNFWQGQRRLGQGRASNKLRAIVHKFAAKSNERIVEKN
jgi:hypothetical protein